MISKKIELEYWTQETHRSRKLQIDPLFNLNSNLEDHHIFGKLNSDETIKIHKQRHDFITNRLNFLPRKFRKNKKIISWSNMASTLELFSFEIRHLIFLNTNCSESEVNDFCISRRYSEKLFEEIILDLWRKLENGKQKNND